MNKGFMIENVFGWTMTLGAEMQDYKRFHRMKDHRHDKALDAFRDMFFSADVVVDSLYFHDQRIYFEITDGCVSIRQLADLAARINVAMTDFVIKHNTIDIESYVVEHTTIVPIDHDVIQHLIQEIESLAAI